LLLSATYRKGREKAYAMQNRSLWKPLAGMIFALALAAAIVALDSGF
jgi:hypothetical protein